MSEQKKLIKLPPTPGSLSALLEQGPAAIRMMASANGHRSLEPVSTRMDAEVSDIIQAPLRRPPASRQQAAQADVDGLRRGMVVRHKPTGKRVTILSITASGCEVVDHHGKKWLAKRMDLA